MDAEEIFYPEREKDLYDALGIEQMNHEELSDIKRELHKRCKDKLKGARNGDIGWDKEGNLYIRPRGTKLNIATGANLKDYK